MVPGIGPSDAKLVLCGEAPGAEEEQLGVPFVGPSGHLVDELLQSCGMSRSKVYLTNVVKVRPPNNDLTKLKMIGYSIEEFIPLLWEEISSINPNAILAFGNVALNALTGHHGIQKWRGSILQSCRGYPKVIPTIHPASLLHKSSKGMASWKDLAFIRFDVDRAIEESKTKEFNLPVRNLSVCHSSLDLYRFLDRNQNAREVSVDIETFKTLPVCVALAFNRNEAISIPLLDILSDKNPTGIALHELNHIWKDLSEILGDPSIGKIGQNFKFDEKILNERKLRVNGFFFDTMLGFKCLYPELYSKLEFISSVLTREPYYKDEGKEYNPKRDEPSRLYLYNARDAVVTQECKEAELEDMHELGLESFFFDRIMPLHPFYMRLESRGIRVDEKKREELQRKYSAELEELYVELYNLVDEATDHQMREFNVNSSTKDVPLLLYIYLKLPKRKATDETTLDALMRNHAKGPKKRILELILRARKLRKVLGPNYLAAKCHPDGRMRTGVRIYMETGRTSTSILKPPVTTESLGMAFQTLTKHGEVGSDLRSMFIPDEGQVFIEADLAQAESRVVAILSRDEKLLRIFQYGIDIHRMTAAWVFDRAPEELLLSFFEATQDFKRKEIASKINEVLKREISSSDRQLGKTFRHAGERDMKKRRASEITGLSEWRTQKILDKFHTTNPGIRNVYFKEVVEFLAHNDRCLWNPFGRRRQFLNKWGEELFREAYSELPQSTVSDHLKFALIRIEERCPFLKFVQESHDSGLGLCPSEMVSVSTRVIKEELESEIDFSRCSLPREKLIIPCEIKVGQNWGDMKVYGQE